MRSSLSLLTELIGAPVPATSGVLRAPQLPQCEVDPLYARIPLLSGYANDSNATCNP
jgi:hypothetical protein